MNIKIEVSHSGSCPHSLEGIKRINNTEFIVYPQYRSSKGRSEESLKGNGARLELRILNTGKKKQKVIIYIDWQKTKSRQWQVKNYHDYAYTCHNGEDWKMVASSDIDGSVATFILLIPPGKIEVAHYPIYNLPELQKDLRAWKRKGAQVTFYGKSQKGRSLPMVSNNKKGGKEKLLILVRNHAYETAGSYCARGIASFFLGKGDLAQYLLSRFNIYLLPMTNIDGVEDGMSRLTCPDGADLNRLYTKEDSAHEAMLALIDKEKPELLLNYHNWQDKFIDGMWCANKFYQKTILNYLSDLYRDGKRLKSWLASDKKVEFGFEKGSIQDYVEEKYKTITATFEFPWFNRTTQRMEELGRQSLIAFLLARIESKDYPSIPEFK